MLTMNVIEPAETELASPVLIAPKKNETVRLFADYKKPKTVRVRDSYTFPRIIAFIDFLVKVQFFSTLDTNIDN